jgi:hypothetical protein
MYIYMDIVIIYVHTSIGHYAPVQMHAIHLYIYIFIYIYTIYIHYINTLHIYVDIDLVTINFQGASAAPMS